MKKQRTREEINRELTIVIIIFFIFCWPIGLACLIAKHIYNEKMDEIDASK